ncbi:MAG: hypothetical protein ACI4EE_10495 [Lachnospiraceae bacterium]
MSHFYAQINSDNIVIAVSDLSGEIAESHPMHDLMIPILEYDTSLLQTQTDTEIVTHKCVGKDDGGYGIFEEIKEPIPEPQPTEQQIEQAELSTSIEYNNCLREMELDTK